MFLTIQELLTTRAELKNALTEGVIAALFKRRNETYYIKAEGEVDLALLQKNHFLPIEVKNTITLQEKDLKQVMKYKNGIVGYAGTNVGRFRHLLTLPIPLLACLADFPLLLNQR